MEKMICFHNIFFGDVLGFKFFKDLFGGFKMFQRWSVRGLVLGIF